MTAKRRILWALFGLYLISTVPVALYESRYDHPSFLLVWLGSILLFLLPVTVALICLVALDRIILNSRTPFFAWIVVGLILPALSYWLIYEGPRKRQMNQIRRATSENIDATVEAIVDEQLMDSYGAIGVRLKYSVLYRQPIDLTQKYAPTSGVQGVADGHTSVQFIVIRREVLPTVSGTFPAGRYTVVEDFIPTFMPGAFSESDRPDSIPTIGMSGTQRAAGSHHCFQWSANQKRSVIELAPSQLFRVSVFAGVAIGEPTRTGTSQHMYLLSDFLRTADREQAIECNH